MSGCTHAFSERQKCGIVELNVGKDHVHIIVMIPPKVSVSDYKGIIKGGTAIRVFNKFRRLKKRPYRGNHFRARGCCVDTAGPDAEKIRLYVKYQEEKERRAERGRFYGCFNLIRNNNTPAPQGRGRRHTYSLSGVNSIHPPFFGGGLFIQQYKALSSLIRG